MKKRKHLNVWLAMSMFLLLMVSTAAGGTIYVDADASGANDGSSWADAYNYLQDALADANSGDEIWVAQGIYKPDQGIGITPGDREATFQLINGVTIKGGYAGYDQPDPNARDIEEYETTLSGDLNGDDVEVVDPCDLLSEPSRAENSYHVVTGSGTDANAVLDGFTITAGNANEDYPSPHRDGAGMYNESGSPTVTNCIFRGNSAGWGGGMYNGLSNPTLTNCTFSDNSASSFGGGMWNDSGSPTLTNCTFSGNVALKGGGMHNYWYSSPTLTNCTFVGNYAADNGGGMHNYYSSPSLTHCTFRDNSAGEGGGMHNGNSSPILVNCIFSGNLARHSGGGMKNFKASPTLTNCTFTGNSAEDGGGMRNYKGSPRLINCMFSTNLASGNGGGVSSDRLSWSNPKLTNCILWGNSDKDGIDESAQLYYGGVVNYCCIQGWTGRLGGTGNIGADPCFVEPGPISCWKFDEGEGTTVYDSAGNNDGTIYGATWTTGQIDGALNFDGVGDYVSISPITLSANWTLSGWFKVSYDIGNVIIGGSGTYYNYLVFRHSVDDIVLETNTNSDHVCICRGVVNSSVDDWTYYTITRSGNTVSGYKNGVFVDDATLPIGDDNTITKIGGYGTVAYHNYKGSMDKVAIYSRALSDGEIQQLYQNGLSGNAYVHNGDYRLLPDSPCINAGDPDYIAEPNETDLDGKPRVIGGRIDMGAYEYPNTTPVACIVGGERIVECESCWGARVTLDGSCSSDADSAPGTNDDIVSFDWYKVDACDPNFEDFLASGEIIDCNLPLGEHIIVLEVIDKAGAFDTNEVMIIVQDTTPPDFTLSVTPTMLWPANHKMVLITPSWTASDICDESPEVTLVNITMNEGDEAKGDGHTAGDIQIGDDGSIYLRAERSGAGSGRIYTITYQAVDDSGNVAVARATVTVPHDQR